MAGGVLVLLGLGLEAGEEIVGNYCGTGMHAGVMYIRGEVEDYKLGKEIKDVEMLLNVVLGLIVLGKYDELRDYLNSYLHTINDGLLNIETGLDEINILLSSKLVLAKSKEIQVNLTITANLRCSRKHILDLVAVLGNVLDNAIEAVQGLDLPQRLVSVHFWQDPLEYIFEIANPMPTSSPCAPELYFKEGYSTKQEGRGVGLFIVKRLTERLGGRVSVDQGDGQFRVTLEIPKHRLED